MNQGTNIVQFLWLNVASLYKHLLQFQKVIPYVFVLIDELVFVCGFLHLEVLASNRFDRCLEVLLKFLDLH